MKKIKQKKQETRSKEQEIRNKKQGTRNKEKLDLEAFVITLKMHLKIIIKI